MKQSAPLLLRPVHMWFFGWERTAPYIYRVAAVATGAAFTSTVLWLINIDLVIAIPLAVAGWIALGVAQEHDERVHLPVDTEFLADLRLKVDPILDARGLTFNFSHGPCRARRDRTETFLYEKGDLEEGCIDLWICRDVTDETLEVIYSSRDLSESLASGGHTTLAHRLTYTQSSSDDVDALVEAFAKVPSAFWDDP